MLPDRCPAGPTRTFRFAPLATSFFTSSRLVRLPEPMGAGSPLSSSPRFGLRTHVRVWRAVKPERWSQNAAHLEAGPLPAREFETIRARWREAAEASWAGQT